MADEKVKFSEFETLPILDGSEKFTIWKEGWSEPKNVTAQELKSYLNITGIDMKSVPPGSALPVIPSDQERKMQVLKGTYNGNLTVTKDMGILWAKDGVWSIDMQWDLPQGTNGANGKTIENFNPAKVGGYPTGSQIFFEGVIYEVKSGQTATIGQSPTTNPEKFDTVFEGGGGVESTASIPSTNSFNYKDESSFIRAKYITSNGTITDNANGIITQKINIPAGVTRLWFDTQIANTQPLYANYYDASDVRLSTLSLKNAGASGGWRDIPAGATKVQATIRSQAGEAVDLSKVIIRFTDILGLSDNPIVYAKELKGGIDPVGYSLTPGLNKFNPNPGRYWIGYLNGYNVGDPNTGNLSLNANGITSDYIYCKGQAKIHLLKSVTSLGGGTVVFYDSNYVVNGSASLFSAGQLRGSANIPATAVYLRATVHRKANAGDPSEDLTKVVLSFTEVSEVVPFELLITKIGGYGFAKDENASFSQYLAGKTLVYLGDSIVAGGYPTIVATNLGMTVVNVGYDGCRWTNDVNTKIDFSDAPTESGANRIMNQVYRLLRRVTPTNTVVPETSSSDVFGGGFAYPVNGLATLVKSAVKVIVVHCGTNDAGNTLPKGSLTAVDEVAYTAVDKKTMWGAIKWAVSVLKKHFPDAEIILATPIQRIDGTRANLYEYVQIVKQSSEQFACKCINLFQNSGISKENGATYLPDGLHPNSAGQQLIARYSSTFIFNEIKY
ncbi:SGNH/GDSL hydrolase family protein [Sphingobacterium hungaricum]|uniref:SGNH hydrolase-type esterase domain-containing protein n=1 Tax=Sphingobacterium hungaricum TaxID=2082723 RepID=A0A928YNX9_9SPHI|nr:GDSL-type esterase/lipase family protein [Sphingobacterium hungaricum]MBE8712526.1 hypothetical protein [Sphingobacterium hungaricum]